MKKTEMAKKRVTMKDLAQATGLTVPTISKILNGKDNFCSVAKKEEVLQLARQYDYKPNIGYRIMTGMETNIAAIIFSQNRKTFEEHCLHLFVALNRGLEQRGYATYSAVMTFDAEVNLSKIRELETRGCRSFVFIGSPVGERRIEKYLNDAGHQHIAFDYHESGRQFWPDEEGTIREYVKILEEAGRRNFRLLCSRIFFEDRLLPLLSPGERELFEKAAFFVESNSPTQFADGQKAAVEILRQTPDLQGLCCYTDTHALGAAYYLEKNGVKVGGDVWIFGLFNLPSVQYSFLPINSADFELDRVAEMMLNQLQSANPFKIIVKPKIIRRSI